MVKEVESNKALLKISEQNKMLIIQEFLIVM